MNKKHCIYCNQIQDGTMESFINTKPCNAPDVDGHLWEYNSAYKVPFTQKFPFQYLIRVRSYTAKTTNEELWLKLQEQLNEKELFDFTNEMIVKLTIAGFDVIRNYRG